MMPVIFTGWPDRSVGVNFAIFAACSAACCNSDGPLTAFAEITLPFMSMTTSTSTTPVERARLAISGYMGAGRLSALPLSMPPETGLSGILNGKALSLRSEEHTSELQSLAYLVCRLLLGKKKISDDHCATT